MSAPATTLPYDPLAVDREPTDEQLAEVMDDVARVVREQRAIGDARLREMVAEDMRRANARFIAFRAQFPNLRL